jgi:hypothetical protein
MDIGLKTTNRYGACSGALIVKLRKNLRPARTTYRAFVLCYNSTHRILAPRNKYIPDIDHFRSTRKSC